MNPTTAPTPIAVGAAGPQRLLTVAQLARYLGLSVGTIRNKNSRAYQGPRIPGAVRLPGGRLRFDKAKIDQWIEQNTVDADAE